MANFEVKYRAAGSEVKTVMLNAADEQAAGKAFASSHQGFSVNDLISVENIDRRYHKYGAATFVAVLISFGGWAVLLLGIAGAIGGVFAALVAANDRGLGAIQPMMIAAGLAASMFSFLLALIGLLMAALGQHLRATTDAAKYLAEILTQMKSTKA